MPFADNSYSVFISESRDVFLNLAIEEVLLLDEARSSPMLFFCRNAPAVVLGRHQNPWLECDMRYLEEMNLPLARRISGGGTVYHDPGNLNYSLLMPKADYERDVILGVVMDALAEIGIEAEIREKSSIFTRGGKISGSAFCFKREKVLHHGTILLEADLERLSRSLQAPALDLETHAVRSTPAKVINLRDIDPGIEEQSCIAAISSSFSEHFGRQMLREDVDALLEGDEVKRVLESRASPKWVLGNTPAFSLRYTDPSGACLRLVFENALLARCESESGEGLSEGVCEYKPGTPFVDIVKSGLINCE